MRRALLATLLLIALAAACRRNPLARFESDPEALAVVGRYVVTRSDLASALAYNQAAESDDAWVRSRVWDGLVDEVLVLNDLSPGTPDSPPEPLGALAEPHTRETAVLGALKDRVFDKLAVPAAEVDAYYKEHREEFQRGPGVLVREMLLTGPSQAADAEVLLKRGHSFVDVARLYSVSPRRGGPQYFQNEELPDYLRPVVEKTHPGTATGPIRLAEDSYQILWVEGRYQDYVLPEEEVAAEIRLRLADEREEALKASYLERLRGRFRIVVFSSKLPFDYQKETP